MAKLGVTITPEMEAALSELARERGATLSNLIRLALTEYLERQGKSVPTGVKWGGKRKAPRK